MLRMARNKKVEQNPCHSVSASGRDKIREKAQRDAAGRGKDSQVLLKERIDPKQVARVYLIVLRSFGHKSLKCFFITGSIKGIIPDHADKIARILDRLDASISPADMNLPGYQLHELKGREAGTWSVMASGNWRITFKFDGQDAVGIDYH